MGVVTWDGSEGHGQWEHGANWSSGSVPTGSTHVVIPDTSSLPNPVLDQSRSVASIRIEANGTIVGGGHTLNIGSEGDATTGDSEHYSARIEGIIDGASELNLNFTYGTGEAKVKLAPTSGSIHDVTFNKSGGDNHVLEGATSITGTLWVKDGNVVMMGDNDALSVGEDIKIGNGSDAGFLGHAGWSAAVDGRSLIIAGSTASKFISTSGVLTLDGEDGNGLVFDNDAIFDHNSGTVTITTPAATSMDATGDSGNQFNNLIVNHASCILNLETTGIVAGDLTITAGEFRTNNNALTVNGSTTGAGTLALGNSTYTGNGSGHLSMLGTVTIGTSGVITGVDQLGENGSGGGTITCTGSPTLGCERWRQLASKWTPATSTIKVEDANNSWQDSVYGVPYNFEIDNAGNTNELAGTFNVTNNLTITAGTLSTGSTGRAMTVGGDVSVTGTLDLDAASSDANYSFGSLTINSGGTVEAPSHGTITITSEKTSSGYAWYNVSGTFAHNNGSVNFTSTADTHLRDDTFYNLTITGGSSSSDFYYRPKDGGTGAVTIANDLTIVEGLFRPAGAAGALTVTGDVSIESGGVLGQDDSSGAMTFGSLTIASGGTYTATSGTTTITSMTSTGSGDRSLSLVSGGTFTNNGGTVLFNAAGDQRLQMAGTGNLYNLTVNKSDNDFITFGNLTILNNLDVTLAADHTWRPNAGSDTLTVYGNTYLTTGKIGNTTQYTGTNNWGNVTINSGEFILSTGTNNVSGIRNVGGTVSQS